MAFGPISDPRKMPTTSTGTISDYRSKDVSRLAEAQPTAAPVGRDSVELSPEARVTGNGSGGFVDLKWMGDKVSGGSSQMVKDAEFAEMQRFLKSRRH